MEYWNIGLPALVGMKFVSVNSKLFAFFDTVEIPLYIHVTSGHIAGERVAYLPYEGMYWKSCSLTRNIPQAVVEIAKPTRLSCAIQYRHPPRSFLKQLIAQFAM